MKYTFVVLLAIIVLAFAKQQQNPTDCWTCPAGLVHYWEVPGAVSNDRCGCIDPNNAPAGPTPTTEEPTTTEAPYTLNPSEICPKRILKNKGNECTPNSGELFCAIGQICAPADGGIYTCQAPSTYGSACSGSCVNSMWYPGNKLVCLGGKCTYTGKRNGDKCSVADECVSGRCESGACAENSVDGTCAKDTDCVPNTSCVSGKCTQSALNNQKCQGLICANGFSCVGSDDTAVCKPSAKTGEACSAEITPMSSAPKCASSLDKCVNSVCVTTPAGAAKDEKCDAATPCQYAYTCYNNVCVEPSTVPCDMRNNTNCGSNQFCSCTDVNTMGVCAINTADPNSSSECSAQEAALATCMDNSCSAARNFYPYDGFSCANVNCIAKIDALLCCRKGLAKSLITPNGMNCGGSAPAPSSPSSSTTTGAVKSTTKAPTQIPRATNGAAQQITSVFAVVFMIVLASL